MDIIFCETYEQYPGNGNDYNAVVRFQNFAPDMRESNAPQLDLFD